MHMHVLHRAIIANNQRPTPHQVIAPSKNNQHGRLPVIELPVYRRLLPVTAADQDQRKTRQDDLCFFVSAADMMSSKQITVGRRWSAHHSTIFLDLKYTKVTKLT